MLPTWAADLRCSEASGYHAQGTCTEKRRHYGKEWPPLALCVSKTKAGESLTLCLYSCRGKLTEEGGRSRIVLSSA